MDIGTGRGNLPVSLRGESRMEQEWVFSNTLEPEIMSVPCGDAKINRYLIFELQYLIFQIVNSIK